VISRFVSCTGRTRGQLSADGFFKKEAKMAKNNRQPSYRLTFQDAVKIWNLYQDGMFQNRIAALFDVNPGRVNEVIKEKRFVGSRQIAMKKSR
jgi:predicted XRE-type DNA-binding protein